MERIEQFFSTNFLAPHGYCFMWLPEILWLHVTANILIAVAYFSIPLALWQFAKRRPDMPFRRLFMLFASFITLCGLTHVFGILVMWVPAYGIEGLVMLATGIVSCITAVTIWRILPLAITLPSPTQYQAMNEELRTAYLQVEEKVQQRTHELQQLNQALEEEKQKLAAANEAKKMFVANVSHEIRTPLNAIVVLADKFYRQSMPEESKEEAMKNMYYSSVMLRQLINDILDFSRIEANTITLNEEPFALETLIAEICGIAQVQANQKQITFTNATEGSLPPFVKGDPIRLKQVLLNLISNAIKFTQIGGVTFKVAVSQQAGRAHITFCVQDTGIGIQQENLTRIFEHFVQADTSISKRFGGTGLGLAISKQLVEKMGGTLLVESTQGKGSEFTATLSLPVVQGENLRLVRKNSAEIPVPTQTAPAAEGTPSILVVEDNPGNIFMTELLLKEMGCTYDIATTGEEALNKFTPGAYDLILMDLQLPDMHGHDITAAIRQQEKQRAVPPIPIIAMTAYATREEELQCSRVGMDDFTTKPIDAQRLQELLHQWLPKAA